MMMLSSRFVFYLSVVFLILAASCPAITRSAAVASSPPLAVNDYPNAQLLVSTKWLEENIQAKRMAVIDVRTQGYKDGHIPGAINLLPDDFKIENTNKNIADLETKLRLAGLHKDMKYIIYDDPSASRPAAGLFFRLLEQLGCTDVHILNGGWGKWVAEGRSIQKEETRKPVPGKFKGDIKNAVTVKADYILRKSTNKEFALIDARSIEEFNGWQFYGEKRGGHIPGAVNIDYRSFFGPDKTLLPYGEMKKLLTSRGITDGKEVASYCTDGTRSGLAYFVLRLMGYQHCAVYDQSILAWAADPSLPMDKLARYEKLVYPAWLKALLEGKNPPKYSGKKYVVLEARYTGFSVAQLASVRETGYIPGAVSVNICYFDLGKDTTNYYPNWSHPDHGNLLPPDKLRKAIADLGITKDTVVVVYGNGKIIPMIASRAAWALMYAGVEDVRILNGGFTAWAAAGYPVAASPAVPQAVADFGATVPVHPEYYAKLDYVRSLAQGKNKMVSLVDVRKFEEFDGRLCPYPFFDKKGHIPGAVWQGDWDTLVNMKDDTYRSYPEVAEKWNKLGITPDKEPVFYCGGGWRSSIGFLYAYLMGFERMRNYDGGFYEWSFYPGNRIITSAPK
ncbi:MAG: rhodanese-like domain-containing protein [Syntrophales bacterium]